MRIINLILVLILLLIIFSSFLLTSLNETLISLDLLFFTFDVQLGAALLFSFLLGGLITLVLELLYFSGRRNH
tara:strand:+ start:75 stop:293 length:219 start_codon:yes stop_codon:yes gene_type:complete